MAKIAVKAVKQPIFDSSTAVDRKCFVFMLILITTFKWSYFIVLPEQSFWKVGKLKAVGGGADSRKIFLKSICTKSLKCFSVKRPSLTKLTFVKMYFGF